eukprot:2771326-Pyramimonas_sp.AAC.2
MARAHTPHLSATRTAIIQLVGNGNIEAALLSIAIERRFVAQTLQLHLRHCKIASGRCYMRNLRVHPNLNKRHKGRSLRLFIHCCVHPCIHE